ncbi:MAG: glycosyltransferase family 2 protein [Myxococcota bacterium]|jgi:dolichol-phosphate mannosyltransferase|nr:glycosyltransferase family 2 protein [Myxococcota bacterium]
MSDSTHNFISIVVPAYNEEACLPLLAQVIEQTFSTTQWDYEVIIVNDGSTDRTGPILDSLASQDPRVRGLHLARNFGHQAAMLAGLSESRGQAVITMDADLEQPPSVILEMLERWKNGAQIVHGVRQDHPSTGWWKRTSSRWFYKVLRFLSRIPIEPGMLDFRLYDRTVADALLSMPEADFFLRGLSVWVGFAQVRLPYRASKRVAGRTKFHTRAMFAFALRGITSFTTFPLRLATYLGLLMTLVSLGFGTYVGIRHFFWEHPQPGYASTILLIAFLMGVQFLLIGLLGEYVGRIHLEVKHRPRFLVARRTSRKPQ